MGIWVASSGVAATEYPVMGADMLKVLLLRCRFLLRWATVRSGYRSLQLAWTRRL